jgi:hypothetical protein
VTPSENPDSSVSSSLSQNLAPCGPCADGSHSVLFYTNTPSLLFTLEKFVAEGLKAGESTVVIATSLHLNVLEENLDRRGIRLMEALASDAYIPVNATVGAADLVREHRLDEEMLRNVVKHLLSRARTRGRKVRLFGEMVAILWQRGYLTEALRLEELWSQWCVEEDITVFCAYPHSLFANQSRSRVHSVCQRHTHVIGESPAV